MSIATDEAEKMYPAPTDVDDPMYKYIEAIAGYLSAKREGYVAGRTAEPTAAEIEAAAITQFGVSCSAEGDKLIAKWEKQSDEYKCARRIEVRAVLTAARKAVTE